MPWDVMGSVAKKLGAEKMRWKFMEYNRMEMKIHYLALHSRG